MHDFSQHKPSWHEVMLHVLEMLRTPEPRGNCASQGLQVREALLPLRRSREQMLDLRVYLITCAKSSFLRGTCARMGWTVC